jgi:hypothetical protein
MTYGLFNLDSGNLIDSLSSEQSVRAAIAEILETEPEAEEHLGLVVTDDDGQTVATYTGHAIAQFGGSSSGVLH